MRFAKKVCCVVNLTSYGENNLCSLCLFCIVFYSSRLAIVDQRVIPNKKNSFLFLFIWSVYLKEDSACSHHISSGGLGPLKIALEYGGHRSLGGIFLLVCQLPIS